ncbi:MAG: right-handed parallel beta-helix repeat-containing protein [Flavobacteriaceae bacterium]
MCSKFKDLLIFLSLLFQLNVFAKDYYVHPTLGNDSYSGESKTKPFKTLGRMAEITLQPGDRVLLASNQVYLGSLLLKNQHGLPSNPVVITTVLWNENETLIPARIDFKGFANGVLIEDSSFVQASNIHVTANGFNIPDTNITMRCGILITTKDFKKTENITVKNITVTDVFYENKGFVRGKEEIKTANGTQQYGWGIRVINNREDASIENIKIENCHVENVSHTGIKLTGKNKNIFNVTIIGNRVEKTGGPGIQMSGVKSVYVAHNHVSHSGSNNDSRKWGRGSGLWTWGASHVLIEKNKFLYANGPADSAGAHIDYNCDNIVLQYNISAYNAGGFCEILGNNYNCAYRYNISINDGYRVKGVNGAFQEGKILWLSGYQGQKKRKGPVNTYIYNNTIYADSSYTPKIAIDNTSKGILIANNIFCLKGKAKTVLGDQYKPDVKNNKKAQTVFFENNLFLSEENWPTDSGIQDTVPIFGNPMFSNAGGLEAKDYTPENLSLTQSRGINIPLLTNDSEGLLNSLKMNEDILGNPIPKNPSLGAIQP